MILFGSTIVKGASTTDSCIKNKKKKKNVKTREHNLKYLEKSSRIYRDFQRFRSGILSKQYGKITSDKHQLIIEELRLSVIHDIIWTKNGTYIEEGAEAEAEAAGEEEVSSTYIHVDRVGCLDYVWFIE